jgi:hypothetical protein
MLAGMTWRVPPYDRAIADLEAYARATYAPLGVLVAGSIVRGEGAATSDLDVFVIHDAPWRLREQRRFAGVPAELFVNPPAQVRRYFAREHEDGRPCTAHMFATGELLGEAHPVVHELIAEARAQLAVPATPGAEQLTGMRYAVVDLLDDARDVDGRDAAATQLLLAEAARRIAEYAFRARGRFVPRRKELVAELERLDGAAAALLRAFAAGGGLASVAALALHVLGVDRFFDWTSPRDPVASSPPTNGPG